MTLTLDRTAATDAPVLDVLAERWSTRVYDASVPLDEDALASALEAARWAPSASNTQPWRFIVARRGTPEFASILDALMGFNQGWAGAASALLVAVAETETAEGDALPWAVYDTGQAAAHFTVQAHSAGLYTHQMGGFDRAAISTTFGLDTRFVPQTVMTVGALGDVTAAPAALQERELAPRTRRPVRESLLVNA